MTGHRARRATGSSSMGTPDASNSRGAVQIVVAAILALVLVVGVGIWYFVFRDTAPEKADIRSASESIDKPSKERSSGAATPLEGTWVVDTSIGGFDVDSGDYSSAWLGYRVQEELAGIGAKTAFGRTPDVSGSMTIDGTRVTEAEIEGDLTTLQSDESRRDGQLSRQAIETALFPTATFVLTKPINFGKVTEGATVAVDATGDLTIHGVTRAVTIALDARLENDTIIVTGSTPIAFADYDIDTPVSVVVLSIEDHGEMELQLFFTRQ